MMTNKSKFTQEDKENMNIFNSLPKASQTSANCHSEDLKKLNLSRTFSQESSQLSTQDEFEAMPVESE
jgi:hypothetical protein